MEAGSLFLASTSLAELRFGVAILPPGRRKNNLSSTLDHLLASLFQGRILAFDAAAAEEYAMIVSRARLRGRPIEIADGQIAAIAAVHGYTVTTRDTGPFEAAGVAVINPWET
jgi:predicted nucleic acid-binding protein